MSEASLPIVGLVTSAGCGHCTSMRLDGRLQPSANTKGRPATINDNRYHFDNTFITALLTGGRGGSSPSCRVINIHTRSIQKGGGGFIELSEFFLNGEEGIKQVIYRPQIMEPPHLLEVETLQITSTARTVISLDKGITTWEEFVKEHIPARFVQYLFFYPAIMFFRGESWQKGLKGEEFNGAIFGAKTRDEPPYGAVISRDSITERPGDVMETLRMYLLGQKRWPDESKVAATPLVAAAPVAKPAAVAAKPAAEPAPVVQHAAATPTIAALPPNTKIWVPTAVCKAPTFTLGKLALNR